MSNLRNSEGFEIVKGNRQGGKELYHQNGVIMYRSYIPYTYTSSLKVYFVSGSNGDEFGQFTTRDKADKVAKKMSSLSLQERRGYDQ